MGLIFLPFWISERRYRFPEKQYKHQQIDDVQGLFVSRDPHEDACDEVAPDDIGTKHGEEEGHQTVVAKMVNSP